MKKIIYFVIIVFAFMVVSNINVEAAGDDLEPVIEGQYGLYITNVEGPILIEEIMGGLRAFDETDGDVTSSIKIVSDGYSMWRGVIGTYEIVFSANDRALNYTYFTLYVMVVDTTKPVIFGELEVEAMISTLIPLSTIRNGIRIADNYNEKEDLILEVLSDDYTPNYNRVGTYEIVYKCTDMSGNFITESVIVNVSDDIAPVLDGPGEHTKNSHVDTNVSSFISKYTALDETDGDITSRIEIVSDNYSMNQRKVGIWEVVLAVTDTAGNTSTISIYIEVIDDKGPVFYIDKTKIIIDLTYEPVDINTVINYFQSTNIIKEDVVINVIEDTYSINKDKPGTYKLKLGYEENELDIDIEVVERLPELEEIEEVGIFKKLANFFVRIWQAIISFFKMLFYIG